MSAELRIALLGPLTVTRDGRDLPNNAWHSRQERRLLGILLTARGARVPADRLIELLWPEADPFAAATTLRSAISALRHALEPESSARASSRYILTRGGGYAWNTGGGAWIDVEAFLALTDGRRPMTDDRRRHEAAKSLVPHPASQTSESRNQKLERAIDLYRGDYLADEPDAPWADDLREMLRERYLSALYDLAELRLAEGGWDSAAALARRGLEHDRLREPLYRALMRAQALAGDIASALQTYERCRRALDDELGAAPSPQTRELHAAILRGDLLPSPKQAINVRSSAMEAPAKQSPIVDRQSSAADTSSIMSGHLAFVGRESELAALGGWIASLDQRRGGVVAIVGEAGIGKTRLVAEALRVAGEQQGRLLPIVLRCSLLERELPFAALSEALRPLLRAAPVETLRQLPPVALAQVAELLPVVRERLPDLPTLPATPPTEARNYLLDGLVDVALALAGIYPVVVWCDDAQWADETTLAVLGRLARRAPRQALLIILAYRAEDLVENMALHELLRSLGRAMSLRPLVLGRLESAEIERMLGALTPVAPARLARLAARLQASAGGNPLFLSVAIQSLLEARGATSLDALLTELEAGAPLPDLASAPPLRDLVLSRLDRLPPPARALIEQLAVVARTVSLDLIEQLAGAAALEAARTLLDRQLLVEDLDGRLGFSHELVRSIVASALSSPQRRLLHRRAAEAIAALHGDHPERAAELAFHYEQAGRGAEAEVLRYATDAGDYARRSFGYHAALGHYDAALRAAERIGGQAQPELARRAFSGRLLTHEALLDWDGIMATTERYDHWLARHPGQPALVAQRRLVILRALMGDLAGAAALSGEQARRQHDAPPAIGDMLERTATILAPPGPLFDRADADAPHGSPYRLLGFTPAAPPPGQPADDLPAALGKDQAALVLFQIGWALITQALTREAEPCLMRAYVLAAETSQAAVAVVSALQLAHLGALRGDQHATDRWIATSLDMAEQAPEAAWASIWPRIHQAFLLLQDDQYTAARARFEGLAARLRNLPSFQSHRASVEAGLGLLDLSAGEIERANTHLRAALAAPHALYGFVYVAALHGLARIAALAGDLAISRARLAHALDYSAQRSLLPEYIRTAIEIARVERDFGDPALALPLLRQAADLAGQAGLTPLAEAAGALIERLSATHHRT